MIGEVVPLVPDRVPEATELCVRAFAEYPFLASLFPGHPGRRAPISRVFYGRVIEDCLEHGRVDAVVEDAAVRGVAAWVAPGGYPMSLRRALRFWPLAGWVLRRFPTRAVKGAQALARLEAHHPVTPPHWYLAAIAVDPTHQGRGFGSQVVRPVLELMDEQGDEGFLETAKRDNVAWYARMGFDIEVEVPCFAGGPPQWFMRRRTAT